MCPGGDVRAGQDVAGGGEFDDLLGGVDAQLGEDVALGGGELGALPKRAGGALSSRVATCQNTSRSRSGAMSSSQSIAR